MHASGSIRANFAVQGGHGEFVDQAGRLYDATGSYQVVWWLAIALGVLAALINLPIQEQRQPRAKLQST